jgi:hypothetical protein
MLEITTDWNLSRAKKAALAGGLLFRSGDVAQCAKEKFRPVVNTTSLSFVPSGGFET